MDNKLFKTTTGTFGHGFKLVSTGLESGFACYSFIPKSNITIKAIVLDNTQREYEATFSTQ